MLTIASSMDIRRPAGVFGSAESRPLLTDVQSMCSEEELYHRDGERSRLLLGTCKGQALLRAGTVVTRAQRSPISIDGKPSHRANRGREIDR
jgi:hypothetical protein